MNLLKLSVIVSILGLVTCEKARYDNYRVYEVQIENENQTELLKNIDDHSDGYRILQFPGPISRSASLLVPPHKLSHFRELLKNFKLQSKITTKNLQKAIDNEQPKKRGKTLDWNGYWTYEQVNQWIDLMVAKYPSSVTSINIGKSFENRDIRGIKVNIGGGEKKSVVIDSAYHAREWIGIATTTWIINELVTSSNPEIQEITKNYEWIGFPIVNPDGYVYSWNEDRLWRKTRKPTKNSFCVGADPNRNWDHHFNQAGASSNPCSDIYAGSSPFSEPEIKQLSDYLKTLGSVAGYFTLHAFGQLMMFPYGWTTDLSTNHQELYEIGETGRKALTAKYGTKYKLGSIANTIYPASGSSVDWVRDELGTNVSFAFELRDLGRHGFFLPGNLIIPTAEETFAGVVAIMKESKKRGVA